MFRPASDARDGGKMSTMAPSCLEPLYDLISITLRMSVELGVAPAGVQQVFRFAAACAVPAQGDQLSVAGPEFRSTK